MKALFMALLAVFAVAARSSACFSTPQSQVVPAEELVRRTKTIVLAVVIKAEYKSETGDVEYTFKPAKTIKGDAVEDFVVVGSSIAGPEDITTFNNHNEKSFWEDEAGRCFHDTDCKIHPAFAVGSHYLIFVDMPYHRKSFEQIDSISEKDRDPWLSWTEAQVASQQKDSDKPVPAVTLPD